MARARVGVLLVQLGTPDAPEPREVRRYLAEFLADPRVIDLPAPLRRLLLHGVILRVRPRAAAAAYRKIWTAEGSPLRFHSVAFADALGRALGNDVPVALAMRYGRPDVDGALSALGQAGARHLVVWPLFPQYSEAATGSALAHVFARLRRFDFARVRALGPCYDAAGFVAAWAERARPLLAAARPDHVLMSYHGLPERQIRAADTTGQHCLVSERCCENAANARRGCYRAQCFATSRALAAALALPDGRWSTSFQSRLGRTPWIKPYTDFELPRLFETGVRRLAVLCPAFVADCLETLEEIALRARAQWLALGGEELVLVPSLNAEPAWVAFAADHVRAAAQQLERGDQDGDSDAAAASPDASASDTPTPAT